MISDIVQASFDYGMLDAETRIVVQQRTGEIKTLVRKSAQDIIDIGAKLLEVKTRLGHGQFAGWLRSESSKELSIAEFDRMIGGMEAKLEAQRQAAEIVADVMAGEEMAH